MTTCETIQLKLLENDESAEVRAHLDACPECRDYARIAKLVAMPAPSAELDARILANYREQRERRMTQHWRRIFAAAAVILFAGMISAIEVNRRVSDLPEVMTVYNVNHQDVEFLNKLYATEHSQLVDILDPVEILTNDIEPASPDFEQI